MRLARDPDARTSIAPEARLVLECCRIAGDGARIRGLLRSGIEWRQVIALASEDRVLPMVSDALTRLAADLVPPDMTVEMRRRLFAHASMAILLTKELASVTASLAQEGIRALTFKGPALAVSAYGRISLRMFNDVDILVEEAAHERCCALMRSQGYAMLRDFGFEQTLRREGTPAMIDLHRGISPAAFPCSMPFDELWRRRTRLELPGGVVDTLSPGDHLMVLCVQITRDRWERKGSLAKLCDVARLVHGTAIDWQEVLDQAAELGFERRLLAVLAAAEDLLATPLPQPVARRIEQRRGVRRLSAFISGEFLGRANDNLAQLAARIAFHFRVHERPGHKLAQLRMVPIKLKEALLAHS